MRAATLTDDVCSRTIVNTFGITARTPMTLIMHRKYANKTEPASHNGCAVDLVLGFWPSQTAIILSLAITYQTNYLPLMLLPPLGPYVAAAGTDTHKSGARYGVSAVRSTFLVQKALQQGVAVKIIASNRLPLSSSSLQVTRSQPNSLKTDLLMFDKQLCFSSAG